MSKPPETRKALGKGLSALLPQRPPAPLSSTTAASEPHPPDHRGTVREVPVTDIDPNPLQPRAQFDQGRIDELAESIRSNGIIQPLIVRHHGHRFQLITGERRLRAARVAGLTQVPVVIQDFADDQLLQLALIENIQREDLNPIETAQAFERLANDLSLTHEEIAHRTGKDRTSITNLIRLLRLPEPIQLLLAERRLHMGHARAILGVPNEERQIEIANRAAAHGQSVRDVERIVRRLTDERPATDAEPEKTQDPNVKAAARQLEETLGTRVRIVEKTEQRGRIEIEYYSQDDLQRIYGLIAKEV
ncbi:MAG: ParB/RepB/Spo0J family partition protein [Bryobacteraceae bacterium]|jgi:ParB family chromosome partitioning protein